MSTKEHLLNLVKKYQQLINTPSKELFDEVFAHNNCCTEIAITDHYKNRESIYDDFIIGRLQNKFNRIELIADEITINEISDHLAIVIFKYHTDCNLRENNAAFGIAGLETQVMIKENDTWRILHVHYSK